LTPRLRWPSQKKLTTLQLGGSHDQARQPRPPLSLRRPAD
jgi:hypothetical protein